jgi:beta-lactamase regulating signal transducer with metallopeptidase domain
MPAPGKPIWALHSERMPGNQVVLTLQLLPAGTAPPLTSPASAAHSSTRLSAHPVRTLRLPNFGATLVLLAWGSGTLFVIAPLLIAFLERRRLARGAFPVNDRGRIDLFNEVFLQAGLRRKVRVFESPKALIPVTWGTLRPVILLPACAASWSPMRLRMTLAHELAHVKRLDCFAQALARIACALHWFNPLAWKFEREMRLDREQACDDAVLKACGNASDYASHLVEIAGSLRASRLLAGIPIVRTSQLERRVHALLAKARSRRSPGLAARLVMGTIAIAVVAGVAAQKTERSPRAASLRAAQLRQLRQFSAQKEQQAEALTEGKEPFSPEFRAFFAAAKSGDSQTVTNMYADFRKRHSQYSGTPGNLPHTPYWQTVLEVCLAYADVIWGEPEHVQLAIDGFMKSIPAGAVYFGGTDPGRGFPTAFSKNHAQADPFFTLSQNPLADATYLDYLRAMYGGRLQTPSREDSQRAFDDYINDATARYHSGKLKPGENVRIEENRTSVSGVVAVMEINARLARIIFDRTPDREFYIEESFPLDWMYPYLSPAGQVMKINRQPLPSLSDEVIHRDQSYWNERLERFAGVTLQGSESMDAFLELLERLYVQHDLSAHADPTFFSNDWAQRAFSKWRGSIAGVYVWRAAAARETLERDRMADAAEFALRQTLLLCPARAEVVSKYVEFLKSRAQNSEALRLVQTTLKVSPKDPALIELKAKLMNP